MPLAQSNGGNVTVSSENQLSGSKAQAHAALLTIGWGLLIPGGIMIARYGRRWDPLWFRVHMYSNVLGLLMGFGGLGLGFDLVGGWEAPSHKVAVHRDLGMAVVVLGFVQAVAGFLRLGKDHPKRKYWTFGHQWLGRSAVILAIANIY